MKRKPTGCEGCPFYGDGEGFVDDEVPANAQVIFIAQNPGEGEEVQARPLVGVTGQMFRGRFVGKHLPGMSVGYANIVKCRMQQSGRRSNNLPPLGSGLWKDVVAHCRQYLDVSLAKAPKAILVPLGEHAALALTGLKAKAMLHLRGTLLLDKTK
jgi:DNA polymerase